MYKIQWYSWSNGRQRLELLANRVGSWANMVEKDLIKKSPHSSVYEECERLVNETLLVNLFLLFANSFLFEPPSYCSTCKSSQADSEQCNGCGFWNCCDD